MYGGNNLRSRELRAHAALRRRRMPRGSSFPFVDAWSAQIECRAKEYQTNIDDEVGSRREWGNDGKGYAEPRFTHTTSPLP